MQLNTQMGFVNETEMILWSTRRRHPDGGKTAPIRLFTLSYGPPLPEPGGCSQPIAIEIECRR